MTNGDNLSDRIEKRFYGPIDDYLGRVLPECLTNLEAGTIPTFEGEALKSLQRIFWHLTKRTPDFIPDFDEIEIGRDIIQKELDHVSKLEGVDSAAAKKLAEELRNPVELLKLGRHVRVIAQAKGSEEAEDLMDDLVVRWGRCDGRHSLVLSSRMIYRIGNGGHNGLKNKHMEMWMPISPKFALVLLRDPAKKIPIQCAINRDFAREINEYAAANSLELASHSEKLIRSITGRR